MHHQGNTLATIALGLAAISCSHTKTDEFGSSQLPGEAKDVNGINDRQDSSQRHYAFVRGLPDQPATLHIQVPDNMFRGHYLPQLDALLKERELGAVVGHDRLRVGGFMVVEVSSLAAAMELLVATFKKEKYPTGTLVFEAETGGWLLQICESKESRAPIWD